MEVAARVGVPVLPRPLSSARSDEFSAIYDPAWVEPLRESCDWVLLVNASLPFVPLTTHRRFVELARVRTRPFISAFRHRGYVWDGAGSPLLPMTAPLSTRTSPQFLVPSHTFYGFPGEVFGTPEARRGLLPGGGSLTRLPRQIPFARAMEILMIGEPFSAQDALAMGFVNAVVPASELLEHARGMATKPAENGPLAIRKIKEGILRSSGLPLADAYRVEDEVSAAVMASSDAREGPRAFKEKRKPRFTGN